MDPSGIGAHESGLGRIRNPDFQYNLSFWHDIANEIQAKLLSDATAGGIWSCYRIEDMLSYVLLLKNSFHSARITDFDSCTHQKVNIYTFKHKNDPEFAGTVFNLKLLCD